MIFVKFKTFQVKYRGVDVTDKINSLFHESNIKLRSFVLQLVKLLWGDRNMRYWFLDRRSAECDPETLTIDSQHCYTHKSRRALCLNNKDPEGVELFKSKLYFTM